MSSDVKLEAQLRYHVLKSVWHHFHTILSKWGFLKIILHPMKSRKSSDAELQAQCRYHVLKIV